jgi:hypothetical protein
VKGPGEGEREEGERRWRGVEVEQQNVANPNPIDTAKLGSLRCAPFI